jgi:hypothetical protein
MKEGGKDSGATDSYDYRTQLPSIPKLQHYRSRRSALSISSIARGVSAARYGVSLQVYRRAQK